MTNVRNSDPEVENLAMGKEDQNYRFVHSEWKIDNIYMISE